MWFTKTPIAVTVLLLAGVGGGSLVYQALEGDAARAAGEEAGVEKRGHIVRAHRR